MIEDSYKGLWYPLSNKTLPYEGFKIKMDYYFETTKMISRTPVGTPSLTLEKQLSFFLLLWMVNAKVILPNGMRMEYYG